MSTVYISDELPALTTAQLERGEVDYTVFTGEGAITKETLIANLADTKVLICPLSTQVDREVIDHAPQLRLIANFGAGFDNIDIAYAKEKNIFVTNTPFVSTNATSELAAGLIIASTRRIVEGDRLMHAGGFDGWSPLFFLGNELKGKTLGIFGMGQIGRALAQKMAVFGMEILYHQRHRLPEKEEQALNAKYVNQNALLRQSDVLSLHAPLTEETKHVLNTDAFALMKKNTFIINTARGPLIKEVDLVQALKNHQIAGAALDVYEFEPAVAEELKQFKNVILTPHIGNATIEARNAMANIVAANARAFLRNQPIHYIVNGLTQAF